MSAVAPRTELQDLLRAALRTARMVRTQSVVIEGALERALILLDPPATKDDERREER